MSNRTYLGKPSYNRVQWIKAHHASALPNGMSVYVPDPGIESGVFEYTFDDTTIDMSTISSAIFENGYQFSDINMLDINNIVEFTNTVEVPNIGISNVVDNNGLSVKVTQNTFQTAMMDSYKLFYYTMSQYDPVPARMTFKFNDDKPNSRKGVLKASMREAVEVNGMMQFDIPNALEYTQLYIYCADGGLRYEI